MITRVLPATICLLFAAGFGFFFFTRFLPKNLIKITPTRIPVSEQTTQFMSEPPHNKDVFPSNQWYTSALRSFPSQPMYALPLVYRLTPAGVGFSYPTIRKTEKTIFAPYDEDLTVGFADDFSDREFEEVGDWHVRFSLKTADESKMSFFLAHGLPYSTFQTNGQNTVITFDSSFVVYDQNKTEIKEKQLTTDAFVITTKGKNYVFVIDTKRKVSIAKQSITITSPKTLVVGLLSSRNEFDEFVALRGSNITGTAAEPSITDETVTTDYRFSTDKGIPLVALFPHQHDTLTSELSVISTYDTIRGPMRLVKTDLFTTAVSTITPPESFAPLSSTPADLKKTLQADIKSYITKKQPESKNYFLGTWFGEGTNLLLLADSLSMDKERDELLAFMKPVFIESLSYFSYDKTKQSVFSEKPEFGNDKFNDHHFHYGYFIRTAAVLTKLDQKLLPQIKDSVQVLVDDIATINRQSDKFPYLRNFDVYEGHSWADGYANFADGNNQESTSEAINAWYGVYLWSKVTKNTDLERYALYLYNTEIQSAQYYWFDKTNIYTTPYGHEMASIVWGGKVDFATWFSPEVSNIYGIQLLPFTPASSYLGDLPNFESYDEDFHDNGGKEEEAWGDLFVMWKSFYEPDAMLKLKDTVGKFEDANSRSMFLYTLYKNAE